jgi:cyclase
VLFRGNDALLIDSTGSFADADALRVKIEALGARVRFIVCTHFFSDHIAGLRRFPEADAIAHRNYRETFDGEQHRTDEEIAHFAEPAILVDDSLLIRWGRFTIDIFHNPGHTSSTLGIDIAEADLVVAGDTVVGNIVYFAYAEPSAFAPAIDRLLARNRGHLLTSHSRIRDTSSLHAAKAYLDRFASNIVSARESGASIVDIPLEACVADGVVVSDFERHFHHRNLLSVEARGLFASAVS